MWKYLYFTYQAPAQGLSTLASAQTKVHVEGEMLLLCTLYSILSNLFFQGSHWRKFEGSLIILTFMKSSDFMEIQGSLVLGNRVELFTVFSEFDLIHTSVQNNSMSSLHCFRDRSPGV